jgi:hypothetical protein
MRLWNACVLAQACPGVAREIGVAARYRVTLQASVTDGVHEHVIEGRGVPSRMNE